MIRVVLFIVIVFTSFSSYAQRQSGPPSEAFDACLDKKSGQRCVLETANGQLDGACRNFSGIFALVCVPDVYSKDSEKSELMDSMGRELQYKDESRKPLEKHNVNQSAGIKIHVPSVSRPHFIPHYEETVEGDWRIIKANGIPKHKTGRYPSLGNPNSIKEQNYYVKIPVNPKLSSKISAVRVLGFSLNGVAFEPVVEEYYKGRRSVWRYEAISGAIPLGIDEYHAHVHSNGAYHYHAISVPFMKKFNIRSDIHSPRIGWAVDGFPIYAMYGIKPGQSSKEVILVSSSYRLKSGARPSGKGQPGGVYDGTFLNDYEYVEGLGSLDECNGMFTVNEDYPDGTYAYFLSSKHPFIPRCVKGVLAN